MQESNLKYVHTQVERTKEKGKKESTAVGVEIGIEKGQMTDESE